MTIAHVAKVVVAVSYTHLRGSIKSPLLRGGGTVFGPRPRDYEQKVNKKVKQLARISALSRKASANEITVVEDFSFDAPKTKQFASVLKLSLIHIYPQGVVE